VSGPRHPDDRAGASSRGLLAITPVVKHPASPAALRVQDGTAARKEEPLAAIRSAGSAADFPAKRAETIGAWKCLLCNCGRIGFSPR
jgi:hypothetical protein